MKIYIFPALTIRSRHVKGINNWCSSLEGSSSYGLWNPDRKCESCSNAKLIQTERKDVAQVTGVERPTGGWRCLTCLLPLSSPALCGRREAFFEEDGCCGTWKLPKVEWVDTPFHFKAKTWGGNLCAMAKPPHGCLWLSRAPRNPWKACCAYIEGTDVVFTLLSPWGWLQTGRGGGDSDGDLRPSVPVPSSICPSPARGMEISQTRFPPQGWERQKQLYLCFQILISWNLSQALFLSCCVVVVDVSKITSQFRQER